MEDNNRSGDILIMCQNIFMDDFLIDYTEDFYVGSYCNKQETLNKLIEARLTLHTCYFLPSSTSEFIKIQCVLLSNGILTFSVLSPVSQKNTIHILSRIIDLLKENNANLNFFCPD